MKQKSIKILTALIVIILVVGAIVLFTKGLAFDLNYSESKKVEINLGKQFEEKDIKAITNEIFKDQPILIQAIEVYKDAVSITTTEITEEQKANLISKVNEKYGTELTAENVTIENIAHVRGRDILKPYITPFIIATLIVLVYLAIRYYRLNSLKVLVKSGVIIVLAQLVLLGIMAITRMPVGKFTIPFVLGVYLISTYICTSLFDADLEKIKVEENKRKR